MVVRFGVLPYNLEGHQKPLFLAGGGGGGGAKTKKTEKTGRPPQKPQTLWPEPEARAEMEAGSRKPLLRAFSHAAWRLGRGVRAPVCGRDTFFWCLGRWWVFLFFWKKVVLDFEETPSQDEKRGHQKSSQVWVD